MVSMAYDAYGMIHNPSIRQSFEMDAIFIYMNRSHKLRAICLLDLEKDYHHYELP